MRRIQEIRALGCKIFSPCVSVHLHADLERSPNWGRKNKNFSRDIRGYLIYSCILTIFLCWSFVILGATLLPRILNSSFFFVGTLSIFRFFIWIVRRRQLQFYVVTIAQLMEHDATDSVTKWMTIKATTTTISIFCCC